MRDAHQMLEHPRQSDGTLDLARIAGQLCSDLNTFGERIDACNSHLAYLDEITPSRGEQRDELDALRHHVQWMHEALCTLDESLVNAYRAIDHQQRVPNPQPLPSQLRGEAA